MLAVHRHNTMIQRSITNSKKSNLISTPIFLMTPNRTQQPSMNSCWSLWYFWRSCSFYVEANWSCTMTQMVVQNNPQAIVLRHIIFFHYWHISIGFQWQGHWCPCWTWKGIVDGLKPIDKKLFSSMNVSHWVTRRKWNRQQPSPWHAQVTQKVYYPRRVQDYALFHHKLVEWRGVSSTKNVKRIPKYKCDTTM